MATEKASEEWEGLTEFCKAYYMAREFGIIDPRLESMDIDDGPLCFTKEELAALEEWAERLDNHKE